MVALANLNLAISTLPSRNVFVCNLVVDFNPVLAKPLAISKDISPETCTVPEGYILASTKASPVLNMLRTSKLVLDLSCTVVVPFTARFKGRPETVGTTILPSKKIEDLEKS